MLITRVSTAAQPVTVEQALDHLRQPQDAIGYVQALLAASAGLIGEKSGRVLGNETWDLSVASASGDIVLPKSPVQSITSISYYDAAGAVQTASVADYHLFKDTDRATLRPKDGRTWPPLQVRDDAMTIRFVAGYTEVPAELRLAVLMMLGHLYENRSAAQENAPTVVPLAVDELVAVHRLGWIAA
jgi:uncharacterized phiE125 gp8 family phage protein